MRYQLWDKQSDLYTPSGAVYSAKDYLEKQGWAKHPEAKVVITTGIINCSVFQEFNTTKDHIKLQVKFRIDIEDINFFEFLDSKGWNTWDESNWLTQFNSLSDLDILIIMEWLEDNQPEPPITAEERVAAAMEFQNMIKMMEINNGL